MCTRVQVLKDATSIRLPWDWSYRGLWVAQCGGTGNRIPEFWKSGMHYWPLSYLFSLCCLYVCVCVWVGATGVQVPAEAGERVRSSGARVKTAVSCLALLLGTELGPLKSSNYSNCWVLSPATPPYIDFFFLEAGSQVAQTSLSFTVCLRTLNFWASYLYFPSAVTTGMHPHFVRSALHQLSYMTHPQSLLLHSIIAFCIP